MARSLVQPQKISLQSPPTPLDIIFVSILGCNGLNSGEIKKSLINFSEQVATDLALMVYGKSPKAGAFLEELELFFPSGMLACRKGINQVMGLSSVSTVATTESLLPE